MSGRLLLAIVLPLQALTWWWWLGPDVTGFPLDDAWIHMVYARALAGLEGFAYNPGEQQVGVSAPLWTALLALPVGVACVLEQRPDLGVRLLAALVATAAACAGARLAGRAGTRTGVIAAVLLCVDPWMIFERFAGMEAPLFALLLFLCLAALLDGLPGRAGALGGALLLTRPEAALLVLAGAAWLVRSGRRPWGFLVLAALPAALWAGWCWHVSGSPWPSTFGSKLAATADPSDHARVLGALLADSGWRWSLLVLVPVGLARLEHGAAPAGRAVLGSAALLLAGVLVTRSWQVADDPARVPYYWARYALLAWPPVLLLVAAGLGALARSARAGLRCRPALGALLVAPLAAGLLLAARLPAHAVTLRARFAAECAEVEALQVAAGRWIHAHLPPDALVAAHDAGALRFFGERPLLDLWGNHAHALNRAHREALARGDDAAAERAALTWLAAQQPDALAVFPTLYATPHAPELAARWRAGELTRAEYDARRAAGADYAGLLGLTRRVATFHVDAPVVVPDPAHADLAIFVAP